MGKRMVDFDDEENGTHLPSVAVVGGGVAGLTTARVLKSEGFTFTLFEASDTLSGVWSRGYPNFAIQTPGKLYEFPDKELPRPKDYKAGTEIRKYCEEYAVEHGLNAHIKRGTKVTAITSHSENKWKVSFQKGHDEEFTFFDFVILATGVYSPDHKYVPEVEGIQFFKGVVSHSQDTDGIKDRAGKRVVVVGYGKSAHDCAMNALMETGVAPTLLFRSSHWCVPRKILGLIPMEWLLYSRFGQGTLPRWHQCGPVEYFFHTMLWPLIWLYWRIVETILTLQLGLWGNGTHLRPTLAIEDDMYCGHGLICHPDMFPLMHAKKITARKGTIKQILPSGEIELDDGSTLEADELVMATGFRRDLCFLPKELLTKKEEDGFYAYRQMIVPGFPTIAFLNSNVTTFSNITTPSLQAAWVVALLKGDLSLPDTLAEEVEKEREWRRDHLKHSDESSRAYFVQLHQIRYWDSLLSDLGINVKRKQSVLPVVGTALKNFFAPITSADYEAVVTGAWKEKSSDLRKPGYKPSFLFEWCVLVLLLSASILPIVARRNEMGVLPHQTSPPWDKWDLTQLQKDPQRKYIRATEGLICSGRPKVTS